MIKHPARLFVALAVMLVVKTPADAGTATKSRVKGNMKIGGDSFVFKDALVLQSDSHPDIYEIYLFDFELNADDLGTISEKGASLGVLMIAKQERSSEPGKWKKPYCYFKVKLGGSGANISKSNMERAWLQLWQLKPITMNWLTRTPSSTFKM
jgi:hypothetical protein